MTTDDVSAPAAFSELPLYPPTARFGAPGLTWIGVGLSVLALLGLAALTVQHPSVGLGWVLGIPASYLVRWAMAWVPSGAQVTAVADVQGYVRVRIGRSALLPLSRRLDDSQHATTFQTMAGYLIGLLLGTVGVVVPALLAVGFDQPWIGMVLPGVIPWMLIEFCWRAGSVQRDIAAGRVRLGTAELGGWMAIWRRAHGRPPRRGVPADELLAAVQASPPSWRWYASTRVREWVVVEERG